MEFDFYTLFQLAEIKAINSAIEPTLESVWRIRLRAYSERFHTPLHVAETLDPNYVLEALYESQYPPSIVEEELEDLLDILQKIKDPTYNRMSQEDTEAMVDAALNHLLSRKKKAPTQKSIEADIKAAEVKPKSGGMSFGDLEKLDAKAETNSSGFED